MKIQQLNLTIRDLVAGYYDDGDDGVVGYGGKLDIRPPYQRAFIYDMKERNAVIDSVLKGFPLNVMYWFDRPDGRYEIIDGQQRTISIARYVAEKPGFSVDGLGFENQQSDVKERILNYKLMVYVCGGTPSEKLEWFKIINIAGKRLTNQELRNAIYSGPWVSNAKRYFSKTGGPAVGLGSDYMSGSPIRQDYLETAIKWRSNADGMDIEEYMRIHQHDECAKPLWEYFQFVMEWVKNTFPNTIGLPMKGVDWGLLYNEHKDKPQDPDAIANEAEHLDDDDDVTKKTGIYPYILTRDESKLSIRAFTKAMKRKVYRKQDGICAICKEDTELSAMEADHITPWIEGGKTVEENCQMLCRMCNREKSSK
ncbi:MAG: DUF262 domain-containing protein [Chloroflexi bacterium]|nr:DUF262 domain-containing protein [Chloroflexota bacterium]